MTLILGAVWHGRAIHASDRFVSTKKSWRFPTGEFDPHSNKTIVVCGSDCWVAIGYTGLAYLGGKHTDQLIAEALSGDDDLSEVAISSWRQPNLNYREIRNRIERTLSAAYLRLPARIKRGNGVTVLAVGQQLRSHWDKNLAVFQPVMFHVHVDERRTWSHEILTGGNKNARAIHRTILVSHQSVGTSDQDLRLQTDRRLKAYAAQPDATSEGARDILLDEIVATAERFPDKVGRDAIGVIADPGTFTIESHFRLGEPEKHAEILARVHKNFGRFANPLRGNPDGVPTPFMLGANGMLCGPSVGNGGFEAPTSFKPQFKYRVTGLPEREKKPGEPTGGFFSSQPRKNQFGRYR
jgi:hypothetical protein